MNSTDASRNRPETLFATPAIVSERRADGSIILKSTAPLRQSARCVGDWLEHWARQTPDRIFLADRAAVDVPWATVTYQDALKQVRSAAAWILAQGLSAGRPLVILSDNSVEHALFALLGLLLDRLLGGGLGGGLLGDLAGLGCRGHCSFSLSRPVRSRPSALPRSLHNYFTMRSLSWQYM